MAQRGNSWRETGADLVRLLVVMSPFILAAFAWARALDAKTTAHDVKIGAIEQYLGDVAERFERLDQRDAEMLGAINDLRVVIARMK